jgi:hypothetical protein
MDRRALRRPAGGDDLETFALLGFVFGIFGVGAFALSIAATSRLKQLSKELAVMRERLEAGKSSPD